METSRRHTTQEQREFERIKKNVTVGDRTAEPATSAAQAQPTRQNQGGTYSLTLQYNGANVNSNTSKIDFLDTGTFVSANITFRITKVGAKTTVEAYGNGFLPDGTIHQTLRHTTGTAKEWIANDRLRNRGDSNHTYAANEGAVEIKSFSGETGTALRVLGIAGSNVYGIYADTDNQTAILGQATGNGYGVIGDANTGTALYGTSVSGYGVHGVSANDAIYGNSVNGSGVYGVSTNGFGMYGQNGSAAGVAIRAQGGTGTSARGLYATATQNGIGVYASTDGGQAVYGLASDYSGSSGIAIYGSATSGSAFYGSVTSGTGAYVSATTGRGAFLGSNSGVGLDVESLTGTYAMTVTRGSGVSGGYAIHATNNGSAAEVIRAVSSGSGTIGIYGYVTGTSTTAGVKGEVSSGVGYGVDARNTGNNGIALNAEATGTTSVGILCSGTEWGLETTSDITAGGYYQAGTKVVGAQGAAVADATGAGDVVAQLNALLARMRAHGLIAP